MMKKNRKCHGIAFATPGSSLGHVILPATKLNPFLVTQDRRPTKRVSNSEWNLKSTFAYNHLTRPSRCQQPVVSGTRTRHTITSMETLILTEDNVNIALNEVKEKLGSMFGNNADNVKVGITGDVQLASVDGPIVVLRLKGRFWHKRADVVSYQLSPSNFFKR